MAELRVEKRGKVWQYSFETARVNGKRKRISKSGFRTKSEATKVGTAAMEEYNRSGVVFKPSNMSYADFFEFWLTEYCELNCKEATVYSYRKKINHLIIPTLGNYKLSALNTVAIQAFINNMVKNHYSKNTIVCIKGLLTKSLSYAVVLGFIKSNPAKDVILPSGRNEKISLREHPNSYLPDDVIEKLLNRFPEGSSAYLPILFGHRCGLRLGEVYGLTWDCIDLEKEKITIDKQVQYDNVLKIWYFTKPKYNEIRIISLDKAFCQILIRERDRQIKNRAYYGEYYKNYYQNNEKRISEDPSGTYVDFVLRRECGEYINARTQHHLSQVAHRELDIPDFTFHSLRHTHATNLLNNGAPYKYVQERLGHANIDITVSTYQHVTKELLENGDRILNNLHHM